jgi:hypothetical protein
VIPSRDARQRLARAVASGMTYLTIERAVKAYLSRTKTRLGR